MIKRLAFTTVFLLVYFSSFSQYYRPEVEDSQLRFDFLYPGVTWETKLSAFQTLTINPGIGAGVYPHPRIDTVDISAGLSPFVDMQYRWYYDLKKRKNRGKRFVGNSANFLGAKALVMASTIVGEGTSGASVLTGLIWGMQRTTKIGICLNAELGAGYFYGEDYRGATPIASLVIGFVPKKARQ